MRGGFGALAYGIGWIGGFATGDHDLLTGVSANDHHAQLHAIQHQPSGNDTMAVDAAAATGSLRTLGTGALQGATGNHTHVSSGIAKAWGRVTGTPSLDTPSFNIVSVADGGVGLITVTWDTDFSSGVYAPATARYGAKGEISTTSHAAGSMTVQSWDSAGTATDLAFSLVVFGDQ